MKSAPLMFLLLTSVCLSLGLLGYIVKTQPLIEIEQIAIAGDLSAEQHSALQELLQDQNLLELPMADIQASLDATGWIQGTTLGRAWPDVLRIHVVTEQPVALWNDDAYLNDKGVVFHSPFVNESRLPQLYGPVGSEELVMAQYLQLNNMLFKADQYIEQLQLDNRGNWEFQSNIGLDVLLGKTALMERVRRLLQITDHIALEHSLADIEQIDTRYVNGAAVAWKATKKIDLATNYNSQREPNL